MEIRFLTKEQSNKERQSAFLKLSPAERVMAFLELSRRMKSFPTQADNTSAQNFIIQ